MCGIIIIAIILLALCAVCPPLGGLLIIIFGAAFGRMNARASHEEYERNHK